MKKILSIVILSIFFYCSYFWWQRYNCHTKQTRSIKKYMHNKLWRDHAIEKLEAQYDEIIHRKILSDEEYNQQLGLKLIEEAQEVITATNKDELISEIGDVYEVLDCIIALHKLSSDTIEQRRVDKRKDRGSYKQRKFVTFTESKPGSFLDVYCSKDPKKYPLIVD